jgi:hypothetical protein
LIVFIFSSSFCTDDLLREVCVEDDPFCFHANDILLRGCRDGTRMRLGVLMFRFLPRRK